MASQYQQMLRDKDAHLERLTQELIQKQKTIDIMQHRPVPKPRTNIHVPDPQMVKEMEELKQQLTDARQLLQNEKKYRETSEQRNRELRSKLEKFGEESISSTSQLQTAQSELEQMRRERKSVSVCVIVSGCGSGRGPVLILGHLVLMAVSFTR